MPSTRVTVDRDDRGKLAEFLNANASTFAEFDFDGWHASGQKFTAPEIGDDSIVAFGCVYTDAVRNVQAFGRGQNASIPPRSGSFTLELYMSKHSEKLWGDAFNAAFDAFDAVEDDPVPGITLKLQTWAGPSPADAYGDAYPDFVSLAVSIDYQGYQNP